MNWEKVSMQRIHAEIDEAISVGRKIKVDPGWLKRQLDYCTRLSKELSKLQDILDHIEVAARAEGLRGTGVFEET